MGGSNDGQNSTTRNESRGAAMGGVSKGDLNSATEGSNEGNNPTIDDKNAGADEVCNAGAY